ncbi:MAG: class I tRNA ligase family protein [Candidatus Spechtbacteria bacterium]|nr:class I tRNA ligase family protein [Candidatus Spechtbacteria bacterium]
MDISKQEEQILRLWREIGAFEKSVSKRPFFAARSAEVASATKVGKVTKGKPKSNSFVFYEGPPTANGRPGIHHVLARAYKDVICRYKTMRGFRVERKGGWDTHGLPVEIEVEKALGLKNKKDIETYGIGNFNEQCRQSVWKYQQEWEKLTERMGYWVDLKNPYITYNPMYMESLWWIIKQAWDKKLLYQGHKVVPLCPRCGTSLSSHEVAQGYQDVTENSVYAKFKISKSSINSGKELSSRGAAATRDLSRHARDDNHIFFLAWTTTPWTLPGNVALAVGAEIVYVVVQQKDETLILAKNRLEILEGEYTIVKEIRGKDLAGIEYEPLFHSFKDVKEKKYYVVTANFVTTEDGTGIVHTAVMYGEDDYQLGDKLGLPKVHTVNEDGTFNDRVPQWQGRFVKDVEREITEDLRLRNLLYKVMPYTHSYPFCWRCKTPLLYYAMSSWFIAMSKVRNALITNNKKINWVPESIKEGRFGEWLREVKDWAFSRSRYWGTPLPVWHCSQCGDNEVIGSRDDLRKQTFSTNTYFVLRHGFSDRNKEKVISSIFPEPRAVHLTEKGEKEAMKAARELKKKGGVDIIISSPFARTKETAEIVARELGAKVIYDKRVMEVQTGDMEGHTEKEFHAAYPSATRFTTAPRKGETLVQLQKRMRGAIEAIDKKYKGKRILIVSHGDPLWILEGMMSGLTQEEIVGVKDKGRIFRYPQVGTLQPLHVAYFPYNKKGELDFHRPYVDAVEFHCNSCNASGNTMRRVKDLVDVWFDSGSMPFAQYHFPFENGTAPQTHADLTRKVAETFPYVSAAGLAYPADYICEAVDQTRGWFYTLLAVSTILGYEAPYKNVISLSHILDKNGQKMSKSRGNTVDPWAVMDKYGADALRWYMYTVNDPGDVKRFDEKDVHERYNKFISTLWNTLVFFQTYTDKKLKVKSQKLKITTNPSSSILDKWILARLEETTSFVQKSLDNYAVPEAARALEAFAMEDVSNWYVRRSRRRFQKPQTAMEKDEAVATLRVVLEQVALLSAPFTPFLSEALFQELKTGKKADSVHWQDFPITGKVQAADAKVIETMQTVRALVKEGLRLRTEAGMRVRQPLQSFAILAKLAGGYSEVLKDELNVKELVVLAPLDATSFTGSEKKEEAGWYWGEVNGASVGLDTNLTPALVIEGLVKEMNRHIQDMRKDIKLTPQEKISVVYMLPLTQRGAFAAWNETISRDTSARQVSEVQETQKVDAESTFSMEGGEVWVGIRKA